MSNKKHSLSKMPKPNDENRIVISGIAGRFPESNNIKEFKENLMNKVDLITEDNRRWDIDHQLIPKPAGKINGLDKFDALFFGVHMKQADAMDPVGRMLLEHSYEAIVDAGVNPHQIRNSRTGVFIAGHISETAKLGFFDKNQSENGVGLIGSSPAMLANRISYWLGVHGPSYMIDAGCSTSMYAMEQAYRSIQDGICDAAIVGGGVLCLDPYFTMRFNELGVLSTDGRCKAFDESANGYVRSECVSVVYLQKAKDAKRIYATIVHAKTNCDGFKEQGITFPSSRIQSLLLKEFYEDCGLSPSAINYVETHGTGTRVGDLQEIKVIDNIFTPARNTPLKIGSVKSNAGHTESASGLCSIIKAIIAMESGIIPPNLHHKQTRKEAKCLQDGRITVVTEPTSLEGKYIAINSFGFGGTNSHILLKSHSKKKINNGAPNDDLPRLVAVSGRTEDSVSTIIKDLNERPVDIEYIKLFHEIHSENIKGHLFRGFTILLSNKTDHQPISRIQCCQSVKNSVWFVFSGAGTQWPGMGEHLLKFPTFFNSIKKCDAALKPYGLDIFRIISNRDETTFDKVMNLIVGVAAIQIGLVDVLRSIDIVPDHIIGHSFGELVCAYADGCLTAEQTILVAHARGKALSEEKFIRGSMVSVGLGYEELVKICPPDIDIACRNTSDNATISGPAESVKSFVDKMINKGIFVREVPCGNIPYHSRYIASAGPKFLTYVQKIIPDVKVCSSKWISTSSSVDKSDTKTAQFTMSEYFVNNLLSPVLFEKTLSLIPENAVTVEVAPHCLLNALLKRTLNSKVTNIALTNKNCADGIDFLLQGIGKMFTAGLQPQLAKLYPPVDLPVSRTTPMISPLIKWDHSDDRFVAWFKNEQSDNSRGRMIKLSLSDKRYQSLAGYVIDERNLFPYSIYLTLVWETFAMMHNKLFSQLSVTFKEVKVIKCIAIPENGSVDFSVSIKKDNGRFEVVVNEADVVTGYITANINSKIEEVNMSQHFDEKNLLTSTDVYTELRLRGYNYSGVYKSITCASMDGSYGRIRWQNDWPSFIDNMLQMYYFGIDTRSLYMPKFIQTLVIDTTTHVLETEKNNGLTVSVDRNLNFVVCGGVQISGIRAHSIVRKKLIDTPLKEEFKFISYLDKAETNYKDILRWVIQIVSENHYQTDILKIIEIPKECNNPSEKELLIPNLSKEFDRTMLVQGSYNIINDVSGIKNCSLPSNVSMINSKQVNANTDAFLGIGNQLMKKSEEHNLNLLLTGLTDNGFLLTRKSIEESNDFHEIADMKQMDVILEKKCKDEMFILFRKRIKLPENISIVHINNDNFDWLDEMKKKMQESLKKQDAKFTRILFVGQNSFDNGLLGFVNCLKKELGGSVVRGFLIQDAHAPKFSLQNPFYYRQIQKDLVLNVLRENAVWGSYSYQLLPPLNLKPVQNARVEQLVHGDMNSLAWLEDFRDTQTERNNLINVYYSSINLRDVLLGIGKLPLEFVMRDRISQEPLFGIEYSGTDTVGERKMGLVSKGSLSSTCSPDSILTWKIPDGWSFEDGATVPLVYSIVSYLLYNKGKMKNSDKILIHGGDSDFGQAAINLALHENCEIFTTCDSMNKYNFVMKQFPRIPQNHIIYIENFNFERFIVKQTKGVRVDIILGYHGLDNECIQNSINCLTKGGRYLHIDECNLIIDDHLEINRLSHEISFHILSPAQIMSCEETKLEVQKLIYNGIKNRSIKPIARKVFFKKDLKVAFGSSNRHRMGKILLKIRDEKNVDASILSLPRYYCLENRSYIIVGGLGGFGIELADWLVQRGAKNLILISRNGFTNAYQKMRVNLWQSYGVRVEIVVGKGALTYEDCQAIINIAEGIAPVDAFFNLAVVMRDATWNNQTKELFEELCRIKPWATRHFDDLTRKLCPKLRNFVVFSTFSCRGIGGLTYYGMANSAMERVIEKRASEGWPALAVEWGLIGDVGVLLSVFGKERDLRMSGLKQQPITSCLRELEEFMLQDRPVVSCMLLTEKISNFSSSKNLLDTVLNVMGIKDFKDVSLDTPLSELGLDSMMTVDMLHTLESKYTILLTHQELRSLTFAKIEEMSKISP